MYALQLSFKPRPAAGNLKSATSRVIARHHLSPSPTITLQRSLGNQAILRRTKVGAGKPELKIGQPDDPYEREADRVADQVMRAPDEEVIGVSKTSKEEDGEAIIQTKQTPGQMPQVTPQVSARINDRRGGGQPLPPSARAFFEPRFRYNFAYVRVHSDHRAQQLSRELKAQAFTLGQDIYFGAGKFRPETREGKRLIAHELTHTIQQPIRGPARSGIIQLKPVPSSINGVEMTKASSVVDTNLKDVVTNVLDKVINSTMDGVTLNAIYVSSVNDGTHDSDSRHYKDLAIDLSRLKTSGATDWQYMSASYSSNADVKKVVEALQNGFEGQVGTPGVRENFGPYIKKKNGANHSVGGHGDHIHISCNE